MTAKFDPSTVIEPFPEFADATPPAWATTADEAGTSRDGHPMRNWCRELSDDEGVAGDISRADTARDGEIVEGETKLHVWIPDAADSLKFTSSEQLRRAGRRFLAIADEFDAAVGGDAQ
ncbi:hypothetical protein [Chryseoglobus sp. 28M-23]|uniref:hypothetical protein n=1 Tax=Chryseoglobus sp. 28M-23 TaxID=2772253 RepID=UPI0017475BFE|nr:hypothetical protein [Chryseoglobus sp. 28M-23]QOD93486.1 hypothetical protein IE160_11365 [Chryseoglobus sp. 28M-23]